ncbi:GntR family transcriptional regulator [Devosia sp. FJ2-5-3]|jgi:DNA-binding FadR family transcriptional regulator|uniref:FadR/GntR family transcriptional regulator n=1 Tax=Devosia sp. FJ2-5-3 TaxID=2976680 RepID=UPI0023D851CC|nr:GntR family transcriptional regulator [Devosia sp. FJ2-5-3]WEJ57922.1 GntR family transcriptional regulator [Devosia sp. FJ2-5-3]
MSGPTDSPTGQSRMLRSTTAEDIKRLILRSGLRPGDAIPTEIELCQELGVSRSSVREAIRTLATLDIVEVRHGLGTIVGNMSLAPLVETLVFRGVLSPGDELEALREVVDLRCAFDLALADRVVDAHQGRINPTMQALVDKMMDNAERGEPFLAEDRQFHSELLAPVGNQLAGQLVAAFWDIHSAVLPKLDLALPADIQITAKAHGDLLAAAQSGDREGYRRAVVDHYAPLMRMLDTKKKASAEKRASVG